MRVKTPWEQAGISRSTWYRRRDTDLDLRRRAAATPAQMMSVLREAAGPLPAAEEVGLGVLADILLEVNAGDASASELSVASNLMARYGLTPAPKSSRKPTATEFAEFA